jgi:hypothetical protein
MNETESKKIVPPAERLALNRVEIATVNKIQKPTPMVERLAYTKAELMVCLSLSPVTLWRLEQRGLLRSIPGVRHKIFSVAEVNRFVSGRAEK